MSIHWKLAMGQIVLFRKSYQTLHHGLITFPHFALIFHFKDLKVINNQQIKATGINQTFNLIFNIIN